MADEKPEPKLTTWADLEKQIGPISYAWDGWLPNGLLTILAGLSGEGKSTVALYVSGCVTDGYKWPDSAPSNYTGGTVLWCESESAQAINLQRARKWQLNVENFLTPFEDGLVDINFDKPLHKAAVIEKAYLPGVKLIVVDSLSGANNRRENETEVKQVTEFLAELARDTGKPILLTHHLRKKGMLDTDTITLDRLRGSSAIVQTARVVWALDKPDPNSTRLRLSMIKNNLARFTDPIGLEIGEDGLTFGDAPHEPRVETQADKAADLIRSLLQREPVAAAKMEAELSQAGYSARTIRAAKAALKIVSIRKNEGWLWSLPTNE
ncbi:MAG: hypothetical protein D9V45_03025 [Chloroflexi bacterium]|nr:MAG: hypothetical protein D9V45_03025 [Chloroflexota bacterium]